MKQIKITNPTKIIYPKDKITKLDVVNYYLDVMQLILPYIENRLLTVIRCHEGLKSEIFIKKHPLNDKENVHVYKEDGQEYFFINKDYQLIYQVQNGTIEFHTNSQSLKANKTSIMVFDLDPDTNIPLEKLKDAVKKLKSLIDELNLESFLKTSGGKGYHIVIPFKKIKSSEKFYEFSKQVALIAENKWPDIFTTNIKKDKRQNKIFIDFLRNNKNATCVVPYSLRARENAPISFPISWEDLDFINPNEINLKNYKNYLNKSWEGFFTVNQKLQ